MDRKSETEIKIATWNARDTFEKSELKNLTGDMEEYDIDILALQEMR